MADGTDAIRQIRAAVRRVTRATQDGTDPGWTGVDVVEAFGAANRLVQLDDTGRALPAAEQEPVTAVLAAVGPDGTFLLAAYGLLRFAELNAEALADFAQDLGAGY